MKIELPSYFKATVILLGIVLLLYAINIARVFFIPLTIAFLIALLLYPICKKLEKWRVPRALATVISILLVVVVLGLIIFFISNQIVNFSRDAPMFAEKVSEYADRLQVYVEKEFGVNSEIQIRYIRDALNEAASFGGRFLSTTASATTGILAGAALLPIYIFFFLYYRSFFKEFLYRLFDFQYHAKVDRVVERIQAVVQSYIAGLFLVILIISALNTIGLVALGIEYAIFFGFFAGLLNILPYIGVFIGSILPIIYALITKDSLWYAVGVLAIFSFVQMLESNFITPNIVGSKVSLNPFAAILALIIGGSVWGTAGMILFIPIAAILKVIFDEIPGLSPYGFVMGEPEKEAKKQSGIKKLSDRMIARIRANRYKPQ
jgi:predicted PurR-regulated permease PerM